MKKQTLVLLWSIVILLLVGGCCGVYIYKKSNEEKNSRGVEVFACMPADIISYTVSGGGSDDSYEIKRDGEGWAFTDDGGAVVDNEKAESLINAASRITALKKISESELKRFKTESGTAEKTFSVKLKNGAEYRTEFLGTHKESCAFRINAADGIYTMNTSLRDILTPTKEQLSVVAVFGDIGKIVSFEYSSPGEEDIEIKCETEEEVKVGENAEKKADEKSAMLHYTMIKPYKRAVDAEKFGQLIAVNIPNIKVARFIDSPSKNMKSYGLDESSRSTLTVGAVTKGAADMTEATLYIGKNSGGLVYAQKKGENNVFTVNSAQLDFLGTEPFYLVRADFVGMGAEEIETVTVKTGGESFELSYSGGKYLLNGAEIPAPGFEEIIADIEKISISGEAPKDIENTADIQVEVKGADGKREKTSLAAVGQNSYAVFENGNENAEFTVDRAALDATVEKLRALSR